MTSFPNLLDNIGQVKTKNREIIYEKQIKIETLEIKTYTDNNDLYDKENTLKKCGECDILIICIDFFTINEINTLFRSSGLYAELEMKRDLSEIHGKIVKFDHPQKNLVQGYVHNCYEDQGNLLRGIDNCLGVTRSVVQVL